MASDPPSRRFLHAVAEHPWPSTSGGQLRAAAIASVLAERGEVITVSLNMPDPPATIAPALRRYWSRRRSQPRRLVDLAAGMARANHVSLQRSIAAGLPEAFGRLVGELRPEVVILGRPFFGPYLAAARASGSRVVLDADESLVRVSRSVLRSRAPVSARVRAFLDLVSAGRMERRDFGAADQIWVSSPVEAAALARVARGTAIVSVPNIASRVPPELAPPQRLRQIAFVGSFRHPPNEEAAIELMTSIMAAIRAAGGPQELVLIGRDLSERLRRRARNAGNVLITGPVDDTSVPLRHAGVLVAPIRSGGGTRLKVLEAASLGVPIVTTAFGIEGLDMRHEEHVLLAETPDEFAAAVRRLSSEPRLVHRLTALAYEVVKANHSRDALRAATSSALEAL